MDWFILALIAVTFFGIQSFLYKTAAEKGYNKFTIMFTFMITVELLALILFIIKGLPFEYFLLLLLLGFIFAIAFMPKTFGLMKALDYLPTSKALTVAGSDKILIVIVAILLFGESLKLIQILGILLVFVAVRYLYQDSKEHKYFKKHKLGYIIAFLTWIPGIGMEVANKYAATTGNTTLYIVLTYVFLMIFSFSGHQFTKKNNKNWKKAIKLGIGIGVVNFIGYFALISSLKEGPLSIISPMIIFSTVIGIILAKIILKEELTLKQFSLVLLAVLGLILLRI
ncbi:MAG: DMT family transporter [archaeon]